MALVLAACGGSGGAGPEPAPVVRFGVDQAFVPPAYSGPHPVGNLRLALTDVTRPETLTADPADRREVLLRILYPAAAATGTRDTPVVRERHWLTLAAQRLGDKALRRSNYDGVTWPLYTGAPVAAGRWPVVLFSHGGGGNTALNLFLMAELASRGAVVVGLDHSYQADFIEWPDGRVFPVIGFGLDGDGVISPSEALHLRDAQVLWGTDQLFVLDQLTALDASGPLAGHLDLVRVAAGGFSFGGAASFESAARDTRIRAVFDLDGTIWSGDERILHVPFLFVQSGTGVEFHVFGRVLAPGYAVLFDGRVNHGAYEDPVLWWAWDFPGEPPAGPASGEPALRAMSEVVWQFLAKYLDGAPAPALDTPGAAPLDLRVQDFP